MLIEAPCRLGEWFTHHRAYACTYKELRLVGIDLFAWDCGIDGVTLLGQKHSNQNVCFFERADMDALPISFEVPDQLIEGTCRPEELGLDAGKACKLRGIRMCRERGWGFRMDMDRESRLVKTEVLDKLFSPVLPTVQVDLIDFL